MDLPRLRLLRGSRKGLRTAGASARADGQENFLAEGILKLFEIQRRFALVAEHFEHGRTTFLSYLDAATFHVNYVHLQRFNEEIPVVAAVRTGQRHVQLPTPARGAK
jgi:hypothetical protein